MAHREDRRAATIAATRDSWREEAALQRSPVQHVKELVKAAPIRDPVTVLPQRSESRQPLIWSFSNPVALNSARIGRTNDKFRVSAISSIRNFSCQIRMFWFLGQFFFHFLFTLKIYYLPFWAGRQEVPTSQPNTKDTSVCLLLSTMLLALHRLNVVIINGYHMTIVACGVDALAYGLLHCSSSRWSSDMWHLLGTGRCRRHRWGIGSTSNSVLFSQERSESR